MRRPKDPVAFAAANPCGRVVVNVGRSSRVVSFDEWAAKTPKKRKGLRSAGMDDVAAAYEEANRMRESRDWTGARPKHLVALYEQLHRHVYGVPASELRGKVITAARLMAARLLEREFGGDVERMVSFIAWSWKREKRAHARGGEDRRRMGWRLQFSPSLVTDYRVHLAGERRAG